MPIPRSSFTPSRRRFVTAAALGAVSRVSVRCPASAVAPSERLNVALVGIGGQGAANLAGVKDHNIVALCDVHESRAGKAFEQFPQAERFADFRTMFDRLERRIDAVVVSTPDHTHFHPAWWALERGKHLYLEKPLAHEVHEVRRLVDRAAAKGLATQLGCQRHAQPGLRAGVELARGGVIGPIAEVHCWINSSRGMPSEPAATEPPPADLDWDLWLGPVAPRPYAKGFAPYDWRFWWEFGTGETGNWGCHILDIPFWALDLGHPVRVAAEGPEVDPRRAPKALSSRLDYPARGDRPAVRLHWYQGVPPILAEKGLDAAAAKTFNTLFVGRDGALACGFTKWRLLPDDRFADVKEPPQTLAPSPGFHREWLDACRGGPPASCHFGSTGPLAESVLLANVAYRAGRAFDWDAPTLSASDPAATALLRRGYRTGWEIPG
ncbi:MAG: Gfo/Idh/MocA family oxidoreductase [Planctomycetes bacterium]|nr:Gfo/Idh/MocA family oxidoreductase [Planctomycetota bacterium]